MNQLIICIPKWYSSAAFFAADPVLKLFLNMCGQASGSKEQQRILSSPKHHVVPCGTSVLSKPYYV